MKVQMEIQGNGERRVMKIVEIGTIPCMGDRIEIPEVGVAEVVSVMHTPFIREYDAAVILKRASKTWK